MIEDELNEKFLKEWKASTIFYRLELQIESTKKLFYHAYEYLYQKNPSETITTEFWPFLYMNMCLVNLVSTLEYFVKDLFENGVGSEEGRDIFNKNFMEGEKLKNTRGAKWLYLFFLYCLDIKLGDELIDKERKWLELLLQGRNIIVHNGWHVDKDFKNIVNDCNNSGILKVKDYSLGEEFLVDKTIFDSSLIIINRIKTLAENKMVKN